MNSGEAVLLLGAGLVAGVVNTLAGGGSMLTVPLLVLSGLPGNVANGTNRIGILLQNLIASWQFRRAGVSGIRKSLPVLLPIAIGSLAGAYVISTVADKTFEKLFAVMMVLLLIPILRRPEAPKSGRRWSAPVSFAVFLLIGLYGGAFQAGVGIALVFALSYSGYDLVVANSVKVAVNSVLTAVAIPVFIVQREVAWVPALLLSAGFVAGGLLGARLAVSGGERIIRPVLTVSVLALAGHMIGLY